LVILTPARAFGVLFDWQNLIGNLIHSSLRPSIVLDKKPIGVLSVTNNPQLAARMKPSHNEGFQREMLSPFRSKCEVKAPHAEVPLSFTFKEKGKNG
jgi:hypothetical protein